MNYRDIIVRLGVAGVNKFNAELARAAGGVEMAGRRVGQAGGNIGRELERGFANASAVAARAFTRLGQAFGQGFAKLGALASGLGPALRRLDSVVIGSIGSWARSVGPALRRLDDAVLGAFRNMPSRLGPALRRLDTVVIGAFSSWARSVPGALRRLDAAFLNGMRGIGTGLWSALSSGMSTAIGRIGSAFNSIRNAGASAFRGIVDVFGTKLPEMFRNNATAARGLGYTMLGLGALIGLPFFAGIKVAADFEEQMLNVESITMKTGMSTAQVDAEFQNLSKSVLSLAGTVPYGPVALAKAMYEIASAGKFGAEGLEVLEVSARAASAGLADVTTTAKAIIAVLNAYGLATSQARFVSDVLFQTVRVGIVTFQELTQQLGDFIAFAAILTNANSTTKEGIDSIHGSLIDLGIAFATITRAGVPAAEASTSLNRVIQAFVKPSEDMTRQLRELGFANGQAAVSERLHADQADRLNKILSDSGMEYRAQAGEALGLVGILQVLRAVTGGNVMQVQKLFREIRAGRGAYALMADGGRLAMQVMHDFGTESQIAGSTARAFAEQQKGLNFQWRTAKSQLEALGVSLGSKVLPLLKGMVATIQSLAQWWSNLDGTTKAIIETFAGMATGILLLGGAFMVLGPRVAMAKKALLELGFTSRGVTILMRTLSLTALGVGIATAALGFFMYRHAKAQAEAQKQTEAFSEALKEERGGLDGVLEKTVALQLQEKNMLGPLKEAGISMKDLTLAIQGNEAALVRIYGKAQSAGIDLMPLLMTLGKMGGSYQKAKTDLDELNDAIAETQPVTGSLKRTLDNYGMSVDSASQSSAELTTETIKLSDAQKSLQNLYKYLGSAQQAYTDAYNALKPLVDLTQVYQDVLTANQEKLDDAASAAADAYNQSLTDSTRAAQESATAISHANSDAGYSARQMAKHVGWANSDARKSTDDFKKEATVVIGQYIDALNEAVDATENWRSNLVKLYASRLPNDLVRDLASKGDQAKDLVALLANAGPEMLNKVRDAWLKAQPSVDDIFDNFATQLHQRAKNLREMQENILKLYAKGEGAFVTAIFQSDLQPEQQAQLIAGALHKTREEVFRLTDDLNTTFDVASDTFIAEQQKYFDAIDALSLQSSKNIDFNAIALNAKLGNDGDAFLEYLRTNLKGAIDKLPKNVRVAVHAYFDAKKSHDDASRLLTDIKNNPQKYPANVYVRSHLIEEAQVTAAKTKKKMESILAGRGGGKGVDVELNANGDPKDVDRVFELDRPRTVEIRGRYGGEYDKNGRRIYPKPEGSTTGRYGATLDENGNPVPSSNTGTPGTKVGRYGAEIDEAHGGILEFFRRGGLKEKHVAQIAPAGAMRVWAEPETGGEAYIPLSPAKRLRSGAILEDVANRFGYKLMKFAVGGFSNDYATQNRRPVGVTMLGGYGGMPKVIVQPVIVQHSVKHETNVGEVRAHNYDDFKRQMDSEARVRTVTP